jgi:multimeric flavodoxin WrbA/putative sterol carrier protein
MSKPKKAVAINGSPHAGLGNTSQMLAMLREHVEKEGFEFEEIFLSQHKIVYCIGCAVCIEKGSCWIRDDYKSLSRKVLEAHAIILASPVYFFNVTAQMKTFLDRSLTYGHKPRRTWKPGLAVSVSAGSGETSVAEYLKYVMRTYGAFPVGALTAIAVGPGEFVGKEAVETRAADLARDLVKAVEEGRRYPATDLDLRFWQFMGYLVSENREFMKSDYEHWQKMGLYDGFEAYVGQTPAPPSMDPGVREAWIEEMMQEQKEGVFTPGEPEAETKADASAIPSETTVFELLQSMPQRFNPKEAEGLKVTYQFEVSGDEQFTAHIRIADREATFHEGAVENPDVVIKTPAKVWLAVARGEISGRWAFMTRKYKIKGDITLLMKIRSLFGG